MDDDSGLFAMFVAEGRDLLEQADDCLRRLTEQAGDREAVQQCFRALHSLKGNSAYFAMPGVTGLAHACEQVLDRIRAGTIAASPARCTVLRDALQRLGTMLVDPAAALGSADDLRRRLDDLATAPEPAVAEEYRSEADDLVAHIEELARGGFAAAEERRELCGHLHTLKGIAAYAGQAEMEELAQAAEALLATAPEATAEVVEGLSRIAEGMRAELETVERSSSTPQRLGDLLVIRGLPRERIEAAAAALRPGERLGDRLVADGLPRAAVEGAAAELATLRRRSGGLSRVSVSKLDALVDWTGEALVAHGAMSHALEASAQPLRDAAEALARPLRELQRLAIELRLVPLKGAFAKAERACADAAQRLGKPVTVRLLGAEIEIDRAVAEAISDPLMHLVRNAVDHGLEAADGRIAAGKPGTGTIAIAAAQVGGQVNIVVSDDGRGLDPERIRRTAIARGLLAPDAAPSTAELHALIFAPGFSTAETVTDLSGRGVGMDVVRRNIELLGGDVGVDSRPGQGTSVSLRVPATAALLEALVVRAGGERFLLPVRSVLGMHASGSRPSSGAAAMPLARVLSLDPGPGGLVVEVEQPTGSLALEVDAIEGLHQALAKPLDLGVAHHRALAGATIMPDGCVGLVLAPQRLTGAAA
jgi:two-component system chemotaxis sensor kinase CheA